MGQWEQDIEEARKIANSFLKDTVGKELINRPFGSRKVPLQERLDEWAVMRDMPEALIQYADDQGLSDESMIREFIEAEKLHQKRMT